MDICTKNCTGAANEFNTDLQKTMPTKSQMQRRQKYQHDNQTMHEIYNNVIRVGVCVAENMPTEIDTTPSNASSRNFTSQLSSSLGLD